MLFTQSVCGHVVLCVSQFTSKITDPLLTKASGRTTSFHNHKWMENVFNFDCLFLLNISSLNFHNSLCLCFCFRIKRNTWTPSTTTWRSTALCTVPALCTFPAMWRTMAFWVAETCSSSSEKPRRVLPAVLVHMRIIWKSGLVSKLRLAGAEFECSFSSKRGISNPASVSWRWKVSLALALKDGVLLTLVMPASSGEKGERVSISLTSETRSFPVRPGTEGGSRRTQTSDRSQGSDRKRSHRSWLRLLLKTRLGEI